MSDGLENSYTKLVRSCDDCPLNIDHDPFPDYCKHPQANNGSYLFAGKGDCPLMGAPFILRIQQEPTSKIGE
jgi:hypothetical protein